MKTLLAAILLATTASAAIAETRERQVRLMCGSFEDVKLTVEKYNETMVLATQAPNEETVNLLYVNFETQTSSWFVHDLTTDEFCLMGVGKAVYIPDESPLQQGIGIGTRIIYK